MKNVQGFVFGETNVGILGAMNFIKIPLHQVPSALEAAVLAAPLTKLSLVYITGHITYTGQHPPII